MIQIDGFLGGLEVEGLGSRVTRVIGVSRVRDLQALGFQILGITANGGEQFLQATTVPYVQGATRPA